MPLDLGVIVRAAKEMLVGFDVEERVASSE
jgi:hypothetical protein